MVLPSSEVGGGDRGLDGDTDGNDIGRGGGDHVIDYSSHSKDVDFTSLTWVYVLETGPQDLGKDHKKKKNDGGREKTNSSRMSDTVLSLSWINAS